MKSLLFVPLLMILAVLPLQAQDDNDDLDLPSSEPICFEGKIRVSALISSGGKVRVGLVEVANNTSYLVSPGEFAGEVEVLQADYDRETVTLKLGGETCTLKLASDPNAARYAAELAPPSQAFRGEAIEKFLKENPNALEEGTIKFPRPIVTGTEGKGEGIERFLKAHPEIRADDELPPGSLGPGIETELQQHPELTNNPPAGIPPELMR